MTLPAVTVTAPPEPGEGVGGAEVVWEVVVVADPAGSVVLVTCPEPAGTALGVALACTWPSSVAAPVALIATAPP